MEAERRNLTPKMWCRVVGCLMPEWIDVMVTNGEVWRISVKNILMDLRFPNTEFFMTWDEDQPDEIFAVRANCQQE